MGAQAQQQPVYYDTESNQYFTNNTQNKGNNIFETMFGNMGMLTKDNPFYVKQMASRNYLGNPYNSANLNRFTTNAQATPYAELTNLFPSLNAGSMQGLISSPDGAMSGASRFLAPQTTNTQGK